MENQDERPGLSVADLAALLVVTIWGVNFAFNKAILEQFDVPTFVFLRYLGMLPVGWLVLLARWKLGGGSGGGGALGALSVNRTDLPRLALSGLLGYTLYIPASAFGLHYTTAFSGALLIATAPIFAATLLRALRLERIVPVQWLAFLFAFLGVLLFLYEKLQAGVSRAGVGDLISLGAAFFFAAYTVVNKPLLARYPAPTITVYTLTIGAVPVLVLSIPSMLSQDWGRVSAAGWAGLVWSIILPVYVAWTVWSWASARLGVARTSTFMYLVPVIGGMASALLLGEHFGALKVAGALVVLAGLALARLAAGGTAKVRTARASSGSVRGRLIRES